MGQVIAMATRQTVPEKVEIVVKNRRYSIKVAAYDEIVRCYRDRGAVRVPPVAQADGTTQAEWDAFWRKEAGVATPTAHEALALINAVHEKLNAVVGGPLDVPEFPQVRFHVPRGNGWAKGDKVRIYFDVSVTLGADGQRIGVYYDILKGEWGAKTGWRGSDGIFGRAILRALAARSQGLA